MPKLTRAEYMAQDSGATKEEQHALFRRYYAQFVTPGLVRAIADTIGKDAIRASTDPHMNDIPLAQWDRLDGWLRPIGARINFEINGERTWSLSDTVCMAKEAARQFKESE